jgi:hypothetical protein
MVQWTNPNRRIERRQVHTDEDSFREVIKAIPTLHPQMVQNTNTNIWWSNYDHHLMSARSACQDS